MQKITLKKFEEGKKVKSKSKLFLFWDRKWGMGSWMMVFGWIWWGYGVVGLIVHEYVDMYMKQIYYPLIEFHVW